MSTLGTFKDDYHTFSGIASDVSRKLGFVGIAVIWIFKTGIPNNSYALPRTLYYAAIAIVFSFALDLLQYVLNSAIWGWFYRKKEKELGTNENTPVSANRKLTWPSLICFWAKTVIMLGAFVLILIFLFAHVRVS